MSLSLTNACLVTDDVSDIARAHACETTQVHVVTRFPSRFLGISGVGEVYRWVSCVDELDGATNVYLDSLEADDALLDGIIAHGLDGKGRLMVRAMSDLNELGRIEAKYHLSPIMLLHKMGLLSKRTAIVGGVHLDRDDLALMSQSGARLIVLPIADALSGFGVAPVTSACRHGLNIAAGSFDNRFNHNGDMLREAFTLIAAVNAVMESPDALSLEQLLAIFGTGDLNEFAKKLYGSR